MVLFMWAEADLSAELSLLLTRELLGLAWRRYYIIRTAIVSSMPRILRSPSEQNRTG